jgi:hypothetical protein
MAMRGAAPFVFAHFFFFALDARTLPLASVTAAAAADVFKKRRRVHEARAPGSADSRRISTSSSAGGVSRRFAVRARRRALAMGVRAIREFFNFMNKLLLAGTL